MNTEQSQINIASARPMAYRMLGFVLRWVLGGILLYAAFSKWKSGARDLAVNMANYRIDFLPGSLIPTLSVALLGVETTVGSLLLIGAWKKEVAWLTTLMFLLFSVVVGSALVRGLTPDCGCFGKGNGQNLVSVSNLFVHDLLPLGLSILLLVITYFGMKRVTPSSNVPK